jgi:hypothetical protein
VNTENKKPQISPLRSFGAPVEMTKGRAALPLSVVAEQNPFSSPRFLPTFGHPHAVALRFARCDLLTAELSKERAGQVRPALEVCLRMHSEDNLQRQLGVVRLARADAGRAVRDADSLGARPEQGTVTANARTTGVSR